jgi:hypothetical protein
MPGRIPIPSIHWDSLMTLMRECSRWRESYHVFIAYCLLNHDLRQFGEWASEHLPPAAWKAGIERGFIRAQNAQQSADAQR